MSKPNTARNASVAVLAEGDLTQVVGGCCCHGRYRRSWRKSWSWRKSYGASGYEPAETSESSDGGESFEPSESAELDSAAPAADAQVANVSVALNIAQRQG